MTILDLEKMGFDLQNFPIFDLNKHYFIEYGVFKPNLSDPIDFSKFRLCVFPALYGIGVKISSLQELKNLIGHFELDV